VILLYRLFPANNEFAGESSHHTRREFPRDGKVAFVTGMIVIVLVESHRFFLVLPDLFLFERKLLFFLI
jgi:hypothetical protein